MTEKEIREWLEGADVGVDADVPFKLLSSDERKTLWKAVCSRLAQVLLTDEARELVEKYIENADASAKELAAAVFGGWLDEKGIASAKPLATALVEVLAEPHRLLPAYEWTTLDQIVPSRRKDCWQVLEGVRDFAYGWTHSPFADDTFTNPGARPHLFARAACCRWDTRLIDLIPKEGDTVKDEAIDDWLAALRSWGLSHPTLGALLPADWTKGMDKGSVKSADHPDRVRHLVMRIRHFQA